MSLPSLHRHALQSVFSFCALPALSRLSAVCREWQSVAFSMPSLQLCRLATKLGTAQLDEVMAVLQQRKLLREANGAHKELVLQQLRRTLDKEQCLVVGAPLLSLLESAEVTRKHMYHGDSHDTRIRLRLPLSVLPRGIASLTTPVAPISTELQLAWEVAEGYESENTWSILWHTARRYVDTRSRDEAFNSCRLLLQLHPQATRTATKGTAMRNEKRQGCGVAPLSSAPFAAPLPWRFPFFSALFPPRRAAVLSPCSLRALSIRPSCLALFSSVFDFCTARGRQRIQSPRTPGAARHRGAEADWLHPPPPPTQQGTHQEARGTGRGATHQ
jgi:hypothetical protein